MAFDAYTGLRAGELAAQRSSTWICSAAYARSWRRPLRSAAGWSGARPKLGAAHGAAPCFLGELLAAHLASRPYGPKDLVFTAPLGGPLRERKFAAEHFKPAVRVANDAIAQQGETAPCPPVPEAYASTTCATPSRR